MISQLQGSIVPERWVGETSKNYPPSLNPWSEIYTQDTTTEIAKSIKLKNPDKIDALRLQLAATAEYLLSFFDFVGGAATPAQKQKWASRVDILCRRLASELANSDDFLTPVVFRSDKAGSLRLVPASEVRQRVHETQSAILGLRNLVQAIYGVPAEGGKPTAHARTVQLVVDGMTEVFIDLIGLEHVKRSASLSHIDGEYPDFIRASTRPFLAAYYSKFSKDPKRFESLNRQIQAAVAAYRIYE
ncbi:hypothetical protein ACEWPM_013080 [Roseovarius sp. S4756]|uniref:hypothetical protein n=1 Tax=Roseovarius maritimus TaxID=3342637 RepID=UPI0037280047